MYHARKRGSAREGRMLRLEAVRVLLVALAMLALLAAIREVGAQTPNPDKKLEVNLQGTPLRDAIRLLFLNSGLQYSVDPNVPNVPIDLKLREVGLQQALRLVIRQAASSVPGLTSSREGDVYVIRIRTQTPTVAASEDAGPPPEYTEGDAKMEWDRIPAQFIDIRAILIGLSGAGYVPTDAEVMMMSMGSSANGGMGGGMGGQNGFGNQSGFGNNQLGNNSGLGNQLGTGNLGNSLTGGNVGRRF